MLFSVFYVGDYFQGWGIIKNPEANFIAQSLPGEKLGGKNSLWNLVQTLMYCLTHCCPSTTNASIPTLP